MRDTNCVAVGWSELGDLSDITYNRESKEKIRAEILLRYPNAPGVAGRQTQQLFNFVAAIREGDLVLPSDGKRVLGIGRIVGEYMFEPGSDVPHRRPVEWFSLKEWELPITEGLQTTVHEIRRNPKNLVEIERRILYAPPLPRLKSRPETGEKAPSTYTIRLGGIPGRIQAVLERKRQVILYGPPGTGKTHWAIQAALDLASYTSYGKSFSGLTELQQQLVRVG